LKNIGQKVPLPNVKLTKNQLKIEQTRLQRLKKYLPTLQLKKAMLQSEVERARDELQGLQKAYGGAEDALKKERSRLHEPLGVPQQDLEIVKEIKKRTDNVAGVEIPVLEEIVFAPITYSLFDTPPWLELWQAEVRKVARLRIEVQVAEEKIKALFHEWREVSIRVNLFEKVLIPRTENNIRKIKVFLGDLDLAAVARAKVAKSKIMEKKSAG